LLGLGHTFGDYLRNHRIAAIAPEPLSGGEIGTQWRALRVPAVATHASRGADLTVVDAIAQRNHLLGRAGWDGKARGAGIGMTAFPAPVLSLRATRKPPAWGVSLP
jgi:hypothetical protein